MRFAILSLFPEYFRGPFDESMIKRAKEAKLIEIELINIRDFAANKHKKVDDRPYGGGPGMVMMADPVVKAIRSAKREGSKVVLVTPQGKSFTAAKAKEFALCKDMVIVCGHYEGVDERAIESDIDEEISIGDYVLTNGCLAACVVVDATARFIPGVLGDERAALEDSFEGGLLDCPHYTRPEVFEGAHVPEVLLNGNHKEIALWRKSMQLEKTKRVRPDLYKIYLGEEDE